MCSDQRAVICIYIDRCERSAQSGAFRKTYFAKSLTTHQNVCSPLSEGVLVDRMRDANSTSMGESTVDDSLGETSDSALGKQLSLKVERSGSYIQITSPCENASPRIQYTFGTWRSPQHRKRKKRGVRQPTTSFLLLLLRVLHPRSQ